MKLVRNAAPAVLAALLLAFAAPAALAQGATDAAPPSLALGAAMPTPDTPMQNIDGKPVTLGQSAGRKGTLVLFICNHCPWVKAWQSRIAAVGNAAKAKGLGVVAINANDPAAYPEDAFDVMVTRAKEVGYRFPYVVDASSDVARAFGATHTPEAYVFDAKGKLVYHGAIDDNAREPEKVKARWLTEAVNAVAAGKPVAVAETKALGCSIKFRGAAPASH